MRMWSLHPSHLDRAGLVACWRESLLAQAVLAGRTRGYRNHPQLERFRAVREPVTPAVAVGAYLWGLREEAVRRGYRFDATRIDLPEPECTGVSLTVTEGQMELERRHLEAKTRAGSEATGTAAAQPSSAALASTCSRTTRRRILPIWERGISSMTSRRCGSA